MNRKIVAALAIVYLVWGSTYLAIKVALTDFLPFQLVAIRYTTAGLLLFTFAFVRGGTLPTRREWADAAILGILLITIGNGGITFAEQYISSGVVSLCAGLAPITAVFWAALYRRWPTSLQWVGVILGTFGILLLASGKELSGNPMAIAGAASAAICWSLGSVLNKHKLKPAAGLMGVSCEMMVGGLCAACVSVAVGEHASRDISPTSLGAAVYLVVAGSIVAFSAYMYLLPRVSTALATSNGFVNPIVAVCAGAAFYGEHISSSELQAGAFIITGVAVIGLGTNLRNTSLGFMPRPGVRGDQCAIPIDEEI